MIRTVSIAKTIINEKGETLGHFYRHQDDIHQTKFGEWTFSAQQNADMTVTERNLTMEELAEILSRLKHLNNLSSKFDEIVK